MEELLGLEGTWADTEHSLPWKALQNSYVKPVGTAWALLSPGHRHLGFNIAQALNSTYQLVLLAFPYEPHHPVLSEFISHWFHALEIHPMRMLTNKSIYLRKRNQKQILK